MRNIQGKGKKQDASDRHLQLNSTSHGRKYAEVFDQEWRNVNWDDKQSIEKKLREFKCSHPDLKHLRFLLLGPVGAGKSSFINSARSVFEHRVIVKAEAAFGSSKSHTKQYKAYKIKNGQGGTLPFIFNDIMGLEDDESSSGVQTDDIIKAVMGHMKDNYVFIPNRTLEEGNPDYIRNPSVNDKIHCVLSILPATTINLTDDSIVKKIKAVGSKASMLGMPHVVLLTKIDECCPLVQKDLKKVYYSKKIKQKINECSDILGVAKTCIFPIKNYHEETETNNDIDALILSAFDQIVFFANDYVEDLPSGEKTAIV